MTRLLDRMEKRALITGSARKMTRVVRPALLPEGLTVLKRLDQPVVSSQRQFRHVTATQLKTLIETSINCAPGSTTVVESRLRFSRQIKEK